MSPRQAQWPESRQPIYLSPYLDAAGGRSYNQASQTAGALGGRRSKEEWFVSDSVVSPNRKIVKTEGGTWRLVGASARVNIAPVTGTINIDILAKVPGASSFSSVFSTLLTIPPGQTEAGGGVLNIGSKLLPIGTLVSMGMPVGPWTGMVVSVYDTTDDKTATMRYNGGVWTKQSEDSTAWPTAALYHFSGMGNTIFRCRSNADNYDGWLTLQISTDLGVTWTDISVQGCPDIAQAPNGDLYAIGTGGDSQPHRIYRSTDSGENWTEVYNDTTGGAPYTVYRRVSVDPDDSDHVIAVGWDAGGTTTEVFLRSTDATLGAGATYTRTEPTLTDIAEKNDMAFCFGQGGRLLWAYEDATGTQVLIDTSDDNGSSWVNRLAHTTSGNMPPQTLFLAGTNIYTISASTDGIQRSPDNGQTWESFTNLTSMTQAKALAVEPSLGIIYSGQKDTPEALTVQQIQPIVIGGSWSDISSGILTASGLNDMQLCFGGLLLPAGAAVGAYDLTVELHYRVHAVTQ